MDWHHLVPPPQDLKELHYLVRGIDWHHFVAPLEDLKELHYLLRGIDWHHFVALVLFSDRFGNGLELELIYGAFKSQAN